MYRVGSCVPFYAFSYSYLCCSTSNITNLTNMTQAATTASLQHYTLVNTEHNKLMEAQLSPEEKTKLAELIAHLAKDYAHDTQSTETMIRFLRARKWNVHDAEVMFRNKMVNNSWHVDDDHSTGWKHTNHMPLPQSKCKRKWKRANYCGTVMTSMGVQF